MCEKERVSDIKCIIQIAIKDPLLRWEIDEKYGMIIFPEVFKYNILDEMLEFANGKTYKLSNRTFMWKYNELVEVSLNDNTNIEDINDEPTNNSSISLAANILRKTNDESINFEFANILSRRLTEEEKTLLRLVSGDPDFNVIVYTKDVWIRYKKEFSYSFASKCLWFDEVDFGVVDILNVILLCSKFKNNNNISYTSSLNEITDIYAGSSLDMFNGKPVIKLGHKYIDVENSLYKDEYTKARTISVERAIEIMIDK